MAVSLSTHVLDTERGKPGSGVNALRGEPNVQGACDMALLFNNVPGYLASPSHTEATLEDLPET